MFYSPTAIPCYEQPERCFIASRDGYYVSSNSKGVVSIIDNQKKVPGRDELWIPLSIGRQHTVFQSLAHGHYLCAQSGQRNHFEESDGVKKPAKCFGGPKEKKIHNGGGNQVTTCKEQEQATAWAVRPSGTFDGDEVTLQCTMGQLMLDEENKIQCRHGAQHSMTGFGWKLEGQTGELCFIQSSKEGQRITCRPGGGIGLTPKALGWEVWRFIETGTKGEVLLTSWTHKDKVLKANEDGTVETTEDRNAKGTRWVIYRNKAVQADETTNGADSCTSDGNDGVLITLNDGSTIFRKLDPEETKSQYELDGVIIQSSISAKVLCTDGKTLQCRPRMEIVDEEAELDCLWYLDAAHRQRFFISSSDQKKPKNICNAEKAGLFGMKKNDVRIPFTVSGGGRGPTEQWEAIIDDEEMIFFRNCETGKYLGSLSGGEVLAATSPGDGEKWIKAENSDPNRGVMLLSFKHGRKLTWNRQNQSLSTEFDVAVEDETTTCWHILPVMPKTISGDQIRNLAIAGTVAAVAVVAAPFAVTGVIGAMGFTADGIAAGSAAAGMMSVDAIATGGGVVAGGTVATLQSVGAAGLGLAGTTAAVSGGAVVGGTIFGTTAAVTRHQTLVAANNTSATEKEVSGQMNRPFAAWKQW